MRDYRWVVLQRRVINIEDDDDEQIQMSFQETHKDRDVSHAVERRRRSGSGAVFLLGRGL
jgi:hypothetical protein